jgi:hypothetical protein
MRRVLIESGIEASPSRRRRYEFAAMRDALSKGETPILISLLHSLIHDLGDPDKDRLATEHAVAWLGGVDVVALYVEFGMSPRMKALKDAADKQGVPVELRTIEFQHCE